VAKIFTEFGSALTIKYYREESDISEHPAIMGRGVPILIHRALFSMSRSSLQICVHRARVTLGRYSIRGLLVYITVAGSVSDSVDGKKGSALSALSKTISQL